MNLELYDIALRGALMGIALICASAFWLNGAALLVTLGLLLGRLHPVIPDLTRVYAVLFAMMFMLAIVWSHKDDLIDRRRRARLWIAASGHGSLNKRRAGRIRERPTYPSQRNLLWCAKSKWPCKMKYGVRKG